MKNRKNRQNRTYTERIQSKQYITDRRAELRVEGIKEIQRKVSLDILRGAALRYPHLNEPIA